MAVLHVVQGVGVVHAHESGLDQHRHVGGGVVHLAPRLPFAEEVAALQHRQHGAEGVAALPHALEPGLDRVRAGAARGDRERPLPEGTFFPETFSLPCFAQISCKKLCFSRVF